MRALILMKSGNWQKEMKTGIWPESGVWCLTSPINTTHGKITSAKVCILRVLNVMTMHKLRKDGWNGQYPAMNISTQKLTEKIHFQKYWIIWMKTTFPLQVPYMISSALWQERIICFSLSERFNRSEFCFIRLDYVRKSWSSQMQKESKHPTVETDWMNWKNPSQELPL